MASQVERVFYGSNQVPGQQLSREDIKQLRFRIKRDGGTIDNVVFDPLVGQDLYMACLKFFKNYSHGSNPTEVGHYEVGNAGASGNDFDVEINNQEIFLFRDDDLVLTDAEFDRLAADLTGWTPVALRSTASDGTQHQWLYLSRSPDNGIRFICIEDTKARIAVIAPESPHNIAISDAFDTSLFELKSDKVSYIDPTIDQSGKYLGGSAVNGFVEKRTFAISVPFDVTNSNTFTKVLEFNELFDGSRTRGAIFTRLKIQYVNTAIKHRLREVDVCIGYNLYDRKAFVTFGNCYNTVAVNELKKLHVVTYNDSDVRRHIEVYLEHVALTSTANRISVEVCENFYVAEKSWGNTSTTHSAWKIPLTGYDWDEMNGASVQPTAAALPNTGVLKTDSYIIQSGNQAPFTYVPFNVVASTMPIAKLVGNPSDTRLVFKLHSSEGWTAVGKVERANNAFKLNFSAISDSPDFDNGVATPYIYLTLDDGTYYVVAKIDSYHTVARSIAIEIENENKDWEFFGSTAPDSIGTTVIGTDTNMKADPTAEVIDQGMNVPTPTSATKVLTKQVDSAGREFWKTEEMSAMIAGRAVNLPSVHTVLHSVIGYKKILKLNTASGTDRVLWLDCYTGMANSIRCSYSICITCRTGTPTNVRWKIFSFDKQSEPFEFQLYKDSDNNAYLYAYSPATGSYAGILTVLRSASEYSMGNDSSIPDWLEMYDNPDIEASVSYTSVTPITVGNVAFQDGSYPNMTVGMASAVALRMDSTAYVDIGWSNVSWSDFCGTGADSLLQKVFGSNYASTGRTITVVGRITSCPTDFETNTGIPAAVVNNGTIIGVKSRDAIFVKFFTNAKYGGQYPVYEITFGLSTSTGIRSIVKNVVISSASQSLPGGIGSPTAPVYAKADGTLVESNMRFVNATSNLQLAALGTGESAWIRIRNAGSGSITVTAGSLNRTLSPTQSCDVYGYNGSYVQIS